jgi:hypothetical protein
LEIVVGMIKSHPDCSPQQLEFMVVHRWHLRRGARHTNLVRPLTVEVCYQLILVVEEHVLPNTSILNILVKYSC